MIGKLNIKNMHCTSCESIISNSVKEIKGVNEIKISYRDETAEIVFEPGKTSINNIINTINELGYSASVKNENNEGKGSFLDSIFGRKIK